jgi:hypothetical protein
MRPPNMVMLRYIIGIGTSVPLTVLYDLSYGKLVRTLSYLRASATSDVIRKHSYGVHVLARLTFMYGVQRLNSLQRGHFDENDNNLMESSGAVAKWS